MVPRSNADIVLPSVFDFLSPPPPPLRLLGSKQEKQRKGDMARYKPKPL